MGLDEMAMENRNKPPHLAATHPANDRLQIRAAGGYRPAQAGDIPPAIRPSWHKARPLRSFRARISFASNETAAVFATYRA